MSTTAWIMLGGFVCVLFSLSQISKNLSRATYELRKLNGDPFCRRHLTLDEAFEAIKTKPIGGVVVGVQEINEALQHVKEYLHRIDLRMSEVWPTESESEEKSRRKARYEAAMVRAKEWLKENPDKPLPKELEAELYPWRVASPEGDEPEAPESKG